MNFRRTIAIARRIAEFFRRDRRTLALVFVAPIVIMGLLGWVIRDQKPPTSTIAIVNDAGLVGEVARGRIGSAASDAGFIYYTRYFTGPEIPVQIGPPLNHFGSFSLLTITGDNATWSTTVWAANGDPALKELRNAKKFESVIRACPMQAHWHDGTPITEVLPMAGVLDRIRRFVVDERPVVTGILAVGDAWACTNPSAGRGMSVGIIHAQGLRDTLRTDGDPVEVALAFDEITQREVTPFFVSQYHADRMRLAEMVAIREGREAQRPSGPVVDLFAASGLDGDLFRGALETVACLALPEEVLARPVIQQALARHRGSTPMTFPAPNRAELLALLA